MGESFSGGTLDGLSVTNGYDQFMRRTKLAALKSNNPLIQQSFAFDAASRLLTVNDGNGDSATYSYLANSPLVGQITFKQSSATRMTTSKQYDYLNRLTGISSQPGGAGIPPVSFNYAYNSANQRTQNKLADGSYWVYQYDSLGQVISGIKYFSDGTLVPGQQFDYSFDTIGNRTQTEAGGDTNGANLRVAIYTNNSLNQITSRDYPGTNDIVGVALATNSVTVNGQPAFHKWEYFRAIVQTNNTASPAWLAATVASGGATNTGNLFIPRTPEQFSYDADGNLTTDGRWAYTWDAENRLIGMVANTTVGPQYQLAFVYDAKGRRIQKVVTNGSAVATTNFLYDGWNLVAELQPNNTLVRSYVWGSDLSGSMQGAGGVGGLLEVSYYGGGTSPTNYFAAFDGNGNVAALVSATNGSVVAYYEYGPFGEVIRATGPMAKANPIRFSTKYQDVESDLLYYGRRFYKSSTGTWTSRDPKEERGGDNLYQFVSCDPVGQTDAIGLDAKSTIIAKLADVYNEIRPSTVAGTTELYKAIYYYYSVLATKINYSYAQLPPDTLAQYDADTHTMLLENDSVSDGTVVHEMTHAFNDIVGGNKLDNRTDEGMAYVMQYYYQLSVALALTENHIRTHDCNYYWLKATWQNFWMSWGIMPSSGWAPGQYSTWHGWESFHIDENDINNVKQALTVHLSCKEVSKAVNDILAEKGCKFTVTCSGQCSGGNNGGTIAPLNQIMPIFQ